MAADIHKLETQNKHLESANAQVIGENRCLLNQLEDLNNTATESSSEVQSLTMTLDATRHELQKITILAGRAAHLEQQLAALEIEQEQLHQELATTKDDECSAVRRWKQAERTIHNLQQQMDKIDLEARQERERHAEVLERVERQRVVETELGSAAGRLKGAAVASTVGNEKKVTSVVSHFVTDILQDNANLQLGIVELREMLLTSNEEVESLRECMILHQPVVSDNEDGSQKPNLRKELGPERTENGGPELHVHHHYYPTEKPDPPLKDRLPLYRRPRKKRLVITPNMITSRPGSRTPRTPTSYSGSYIPPSAAATILSQTSVTVPSCTRPTSVNPWSRQSDRTISSFAPSSVPSSPQSAFRDTIFDRSDITMDSSRPTSPESNFPESPVLFVRNRKRLNETSPRSLSTPAAFQLKACGSWTMPGKSTATLQHSNHGTPTGPASRYSRVLEENERSNFPDNASEPSTDDLYSLPRTHLPHTLHRSTSHESLFSISAMDIHTPTLTLRSTPPNLHSQPSHPTPTFPTLTPITLASSKPVLAATTTTAIAHPRRAYDSRHYNRSLLSNLANTTQVTPNGHAEPAGKQTLGKKVGEWVFGKWGVAPVAASSIATASGPELGLGHRQGHGQVRSSAKAALAAVEERAAGGVLGGRLESVEWGLRGVAGEKRGWGSNVRARNVDRVLLRESLGEEEVGLG